jgi:hypothetical protein
MRALKGALLMVCAALLCAVFSPSARADEWNKKTVVRVYVPVEIPGHVLGPGKYVFELADSSADRHIVQVWNQYQTHLIATFLTIPTYRMEATGHTVIRLEERMSDNPEAIKKWFYPGDDYGQEFLYHYHWPPQERGATYNGG